MDAQEAYHEHVRWQLGMWFKAGMIVGGAIGFCAGIVIGVLL